MPLAYNVPAGVEIALAYLQYLVPLDYSMEHPFEKKLEEVKLEKT